MKMMLKVLALSPSDSPKETGLCRVPQDKKRKRRIADRQTNG